VENLIQERLRKRLSALQAERGVEQSLETFNKYSVFSDAQINELGDADFDLIVTTAAKVAIPDFEATKYRWDHVTPEDGICRLCYQWRRYPVGQRHFGFTWFRVCSESCVCEHHGSDVWIGSDIF